MQPVLRSFLAEISASWLRTTKRKPFQAGSIGNDQQSGAKERQQTPSRRSQTACYVPPPPRNGDIASNM